MSGLTPRPDRRPRPAARPAVGPSTLADVLDRVLDKGLVIAGDIRINISDVELLTIKLRLLVASVDTARDMGIDWWGGDPFLSGDPRKLERENEELQRRIAQLESRLAELGAGGEAGRDDDAEGAEDSDGT